MYEIQNTYIIYVNFGFLGTIHMKKSFRQWILIKNLFTTNKTLIYTQCKKKWNKKKELWSFIFWSSYKKKNVFCLFVLVLFDAPIYIYKTKSTKKISFKANDNLEVVCFLSIFFYCFFLIQNEPKQIFQKSCCILFIK